MTDTKAKANGATPPAAQKRSITTKAVATTSDTARDLARKASSGVEANPLSVLAGGVALGVLAGAFVPRSERETQLLGPMGKRLTDTAKGAVDAAKDTAKSELDILGLTRTAARDQAGRLLEGVLGAVAAAATAALTASREKAAAAKAPE